MMLGQLHKAIGVYKGQELVHAMERLFKNEDYQLFVELIKMTISDWLDMNRSPNEIRAAQIILMVMEEFRIEPDKVAKLLAKNIKKLSKEI